MTAELKDVSPDGILLIDKEEGKTSFDAVRMIRRILGCKKTGHAGTLDPFATGLLVILLGQGTKLSPYIMGGKKKYRAEIRLGIETDTCDPTGSVVNEMPVPELETELLTGAVSCFTGVIDQVPPAFSALKVNGQRAYKLARKGIEVELKKRSVTVYSIDIIEIKGPVITLEVACSSGTYIRSLASDIGKKLGTVAHLQKLRRLSSGLFNVDDALSLGGLDSAAGEMLLDRVIPLKESLPDMRTINLDCHLAGRIKNGYRPSLKELTKNIGQTIICNECLKLITDAGLVAVMEVEKSQVHENERIKKVKIFH